jgi:hypothetical protein
MTTPEKTQIASHAAMIALCIVVGVCAIALTVAVLRITDGSQQALATVNRGCAPGPCGTLAAFTKAVTKGGDAIVTTQLQELSVVKRINPVLDSLTTVAPHANAAMDSLSGTATTASRSLQDVSDHLTPALDSANATTAELGSAIDALKPVETDADRAVRDFDAQVTSPDVDRALKGLADTSQQAALTTTQFTGIATDLHKATSDATKPQPWWRKALGYGNMGVNIACLATHSCPF